jgi:putative membrane protein
MTAEPRKPVAIRLDAPDVSVGDAAEPKHTAARTVVMTTPEPTDPFSGLEPTPAPEMAPRQGIGWGGLFMAALGGLISLAIGLAIDQLIRDLFTRADWLGWTAVALTALAVVAILAVAMRELFGLWRLSKIDALRARAAKANDTDDDALAKAVAADLLALYAERPELARGRAAVASHLGEIVDGRDRLVLIERDLLAPLDRQAASMVLESAKRVSLVTAISPRALVDVLFVLAETTRLVRRLARHYGGRPGTVGFWRLMRAVLGHLTLTGGMAMGESLVQQLVGQGLAARLSAKLGEGVVNGLLTARIGLATIDQIRPLPFLKSTRPTLSEMMAELTRLTDPPKP